MPDSYAIMPTAEKRVDDEKTEDNNCGFGRWTPLWLQWMTSPKALLVFLCCFTASQGFAVNGINNVNTSSMERRFRLPSSQVGLVSSAYDVSAGLSVIFVSYFGSHAHKPRLLGFAAVSLALGSLVMTMPHLTGGLYEPACAKTDSCAARTRQYSVDCEADDGTTSRLQNYLYVLITGQVLHGLGGTCLYTLGTSFLDENVPTKSSPLFVGLMLGFSGLGPAIGYLLGGYLLSVYVDTPLPPVDGMTPNDPRWVGAWWIGFTISGSLFALMSIVMFGLPRELPGAHEIKAAKVSQAHGGEETKQKYVQIKDMPAALLALLKNPVFVCVSLAASSEGIATSGIATFLPKILQNQFGLNASPAAILAGLMSVPGVAGGNILAGIFCRKLKLKVRGMLRTCIVCAIICLATAPAFFINCGDSPHKSRATLNVSCSSDCQCTTYSFKPVCSDGTEYFSPCFAGCAGAANRSESKTVYSNCSCIAPNATEAVGEKCSSACNQLGLFIPFMFILMLSTFFSTIPGMGVTLRCIPDSQRTNGLGVQWVFVRFLGTIPGPILFGKIVDSSCTIWQELDNNETGSCWVYDSSIMSRNTFILAVCVKAVTLSLFSLAHIFYRPPVPLENIKNASEIALTNNDMTLSESSTNIATALEKSESNFEEATMGKRNISEDD